MILNNDIGKPYSTFCMRVLLTAAKAVQQDSLKKIEEETV